MWPKQTPPTSTPPSPHPSVPLKADTYSVTYNIWGVTSNEILAISQWATLGTRLPMGSKEISFTTSFSSRTSHRTDPLSCVQASFKSFRICIITMDSSKASLTILDPYEDDEKRKYSLRIDYAAKVSRVMTCIVKDTCS